MNNSNFCYIDCTDTFNSGLNTGIQRVVRNIISRLGGLEGYRGFTFVPVISVGGNLFVLDVNFQNGYKVTRCANKLLGNVRNVLDRLFAVNNKDIEDLYGVDPRTTTAKTNSRNLLTRLHAKIVSICRKAMPFIVQLPLFLDNLGTGTQKIQLKRGDIFFLADSFWNANSLNAAKNAKACNAKIVLLMYDIIPITHPNFVDDINCSIFVDYLPEYLNIVDGIISISKYTMGEIIGYCKKLGIEKKIAFDYSYLGADFNSSLVQKNIGNQLHNSLSGGKTFLMVGTIEPRKNHVFVIDAFERLWDNGSSIKLCIIGKIGWKCDNIVKKITESKYFNTNMFLYSKLGDADLLNCLHEACGIIMASIVEGFGLPLIEAKHFGKTVLASDIPVFREIGEDYPVYFPLDDNKTLTEIVLRVANGGIACTQTAHGWISWDESINTLFEKVIIVAESTS